MGGTLCVTWAAIEGRESVITFPVHRGQTTAKMNCQVVGSLIPTGHLATTEAATGGKFHGDGFPVIDQRKGIKMMEKA